MTTTVKLQKRTKDTTQNWIIWPQKTCEYESYAAIVMFCDLFAAWEICGWSCASQRSGHLFKGKLPALPSKQTISEALSATPNGAGFTTNVDWKKKKKKRRILNEPNEMKWKELHRVLTWELGRGQPTTQETFSVRAAQRYMRLYIVFNIPPWLLLLTTYNEYILSDAAVFVGVLSGSAMILGNTESTLFTLAEKEASN